MQQRIPLQLQNAYTPTGNLPVKTTIRICLPNTDKVDDNLIDESLKFIKNLYVQVDKLMIATNEQMNKFLINLIKYDMHHDNKLLSFSPNKKNPYLTFDDVLYFIDNYKLDKLVKMHFFLYILTNFSFCLDSKSVEIFIYLCNLIHDKELKDYFKFFCVTTKHYKITPTKICDKLSNLIKKVYKGTGKFDYMLTCFDNNLTKHCLFNNYSHDKQVINFRNIEIPLIKEENITSFNEDILLLSLKNNYLNLAAICLDNKVLTTKNVFGILLEKTLELTDLSKEFLNDNDSFILFEILKYVLGLNKTTSHNNEKCVKFIPTLLNYGFTIEPNLYHIFYDNNLFEIIESYSYDFSKIIIKCNDKKHYNLIKHNFDNLLFACECHNLDAMIILVNNGIEMNKECWNVLNQTSTQN